MITPVLLAGGSGLRLWPVSRKTYPKQFNQLLGKYSLFQTTALKVKNSLILNFEKPIIVTNEKFRFIVVDQLVEIGVDPGPIIIEPEAKDTGPAILSAVLYSILGNKSATLLIMPTDHLIPDTKTLHECLNIGLFSTKNNKIITFGVKPTRAETGYGYIEISESNCKKSNKIISFTEKPDHKKAQEMYRSGKYLWNAGIFLFNSSDVINEYKRYNAKNFENVKNSIKHGKVDLGFFRLDPINWSKCKSISFDYAVMEKSKKIEVVKYPKKWTDLGSWETIWEEQLKDKNGINISQNVTAIDCKNSLLRSESSNMHLVGIGIDNLIIIAMRDAVLVASKDQSQKVKEAVNILKNKNITQSDVFPVKHRPWGFFETLIKASRFQVKKIVVKIGGLLSLQSHQHRSEHWVVVEGTAKVTLNNKINLLSENESIYIPLGSKHRLENSGKIPLVLIEIQTGSYLEEDDIKRYEDIYSRNSNT